MFGTVCSSILNMEPLPNLNRVYAMVITEERHREIARGKDDKNEAMAFAVQTKVRNKEKTDVCGIVVDRDTICKSAFRLSDIPIGGEIALRDLDAEPSALLGVVLLVLDTDTGNLEPKLCRFNPDRMGLRRLSPKEIALVCLI